MLKVDAHAHIFARRSARFPRATDDLAPPDRDAAVRTLLDTMDRTGVESAVAVALCSEDEYVKTSRFQHSDRIHAVLVADPAIQDPVAVARRLESAEAVGLRFFGLDTNAPPPERIEDLTYWPILQMLAASRRALWLYLRPGDTQRAEAIAQQLPELRIVLNHCGFPQGPMSVDRWGRPRIDTDVKGRSTELAALASAPNVCVIISGQYAFSRKRFPHTDVSTEVRKIVDLFGPHRVLWGSDSPWIDREPGYAQVQDLIDHHIPGLSEVDRAAIFGDNARRLLLQPGMA